MLKDILKTKKERIKNLQRNFNLDFVRNATFSVGSDRRTLSEYYETKKRLFVPYLLPLDPQTGKKYSYMNIIPMIQALEKWGVNAVVVQTDDIYYMSNNSNISLGKQVSNSMTLIRRDIILEPIQIYESRAIGADGVYLDASGIKLPKLIDCLEKAGEVAMDVMLEVDNPDIISKLKVKAGPLMENVLLVHSPENSFPGSTAVDNRFMTTDLGEKPESGIPFQGVIAAPGPVSTIEEYHSAIQSWLAWQNE